MRNIRVVLLVALLLVYSAVFGGIEYFSTGLAGFTTDDLAEGASNKYFPGFTSLLVDYGFTDNSANWDIAYGWGDHSGLYDATGTAAGLISTHESTYNHSNYNTAYSHSQITTGNPHNLDYSDIGLSANQIIDWTAESAGTIHASNYVDNDTTYTAALPLSISLANITIQQATTAQDGYLSSVDWNTFSTAAGHVDQNVKTTSTPQFDRVGLGCVPDADARLTVAGQYYSVEKTDTVSSGAVTVNLNDGNVHYIVLDNGANTVTLSNPKAGGRYLIYVKQPASGAAGTVTFSPTPLSPGGVLPTLTTTNGALDVITLSYSGVLSQYVLGYSLDLQ